MSDERSELRAIILESMSELEDTYREFAELQTEVFAEVSDITREWATENDWFGAFDYEQEGIKLAPAAWEVSSDTGGRVAKAWFQLGYDDGDDEAEEKWDLTRLCHARMDVMGFQVWPEWKVHGFKLLTWKRAAREQASALASAGFSIRSKGTIYKPATIDAGALAQALRAQSIREALEPWRQLLDTLPSAVSAVEAVIIAATKPSS